MGDTVFSDYAEDQKQGAKKPAAAVDGSTSSGDTIFHDYQDDQNEKKGVDWLQQAADFGWTVGSGLAMAIPNTVWAFKEGSKKLLPALWERQKEQIRKGEADIERGDRWSGAARKLAGAVPLVGPMAGDIADQIKAKQYGQAAGNTALIVAPETRRILPKSVKLGFGYKSQRFPEEERAIRSLKPHVQVSAGQELGIPKLQAKESRMEEVPGSVAQQFFHKQEEQLAERGKKLASQKPASPPLSYQHPLSKDKVTAGEDMLSSISKRAQQADNDADTAYTDLRKATAGAKQQVQVGTKQVPAQNPLAKNTPAGRPQTVPVMQTFEAPVDLNMPRARLQPLYDNLKANMPEVWRERSPAFGALENLVTGKVTAMNAMDFDKFLGAVKSLQRRSTNLEATRLAGQVIEEGEKDLNKALLKADPNAPALLRAGRDATIKKHEALNFLADLPEEQGLKGQPSPAAVVDLMMKGGEKSYNTLVQMKKWSPKEFQAVGRYWMEDLINEATKAGGFGKEGPTLTKWNNLGKRTQELFYGPQLSQDFSEFLLGAQTLASRVKAAGGKQAVRNAALAGGALGAIGTAAVDMVTSGEVDWKKVGIATGAAAFGALGAAAKRRIQNYLYFTPDGMRLLTKAVNAPLRTTAYTIALVNLGSAVLREARAAQEEKEQTGAASQ